MEHTLLDTVAMLGLDMILIATLALFVLHALDSWGSRRREVDTSRETVDATDCELHEFPAVRHAQADETQDEPTRRAA